MSKETRDIKEKVMSQITSRKVKMRPRVFFVLGSILTYFGLLLSIFASIFFFSLIRLSFRLQAGLGGKHKIELFISNFSWWVPILGIIGLVLGIYLLKKYEISYKFNFWQVALIFVIGMIIAGLLFDLLGFNNFLMKRGYMKSIMHQDYYQKEMIIDL